MKRAFSSDVRDRKTRAEALAPKRKKGIGRVG
jgi:hypothetical protein